MDEVRKYLKDSVVVGGLFFVFLFGGVFGAVNWNSYSKPQMPHQSYRESQEAYGERVRLYEQAVGECGRDAVIPWVWSVPLTIVGLAGAAACGFVVLWRNPPQ